MLRARQKAMDESGQRHRGRVHKRLDRNIVVEIVEKQQGAKAKGTDESTTKRNRNEREFKFSLGVECECTTHGATADAIANFIALRSDRGGAGRD